MKQTHLVKHHKTLNAFFCVTIIMWRCHMNVTSEQMDKFIFELNLTRLNFRSFFNPSALPQRWQECSRPQPDDRPTTEGQTGYCCCQWSSSHNPPGQARDRHELEKSWIPAKLKLLTKCKLFRFCNITIFLLLLKLEDRATFLALALFKFNF
jgi:hypothetical protein